MKIVVACKNQFLGRTIASALATAGFKQVIRTAKLDRVETELKAPGRLAIIDMEWEEVQTLSTLRKIVNIASICGNKVACICPNTEEDLKKVARAARPTEVFIRFEMQTRFPEWLAEL